MKNEVYLMVNGEKKELTQEQVTSLGFNFRENPFERLCLGDKYFFIDYSNQEIQMSDECLDAIDEKRDSQVNYFNDKEFATQVMLHQLLYRKLLKFAYENDYKNTLDWNGHNDHFCIVYNCSTHEYEVWTSCQYNFSLVYFLSVEAAERAIEEVVKPFMKEHAEFVW